MKIPVLTWMIVICMVNVGQAQVFKRFDSKMLEIIEQSRVSDSNYIEYYDQFGMHFSASYYISNFSVIRSNDLSRKRFAGNLTPTFGIGITKYGLQLNISKEMGFLESSTNELGTTNRFSGQMSFGMGGFGIAAGFSRIEGYYVSDVKINGSKIYQDEYPLRPDIRKGQYYLNVVYVLNKEKYSFGAAYSLTQKQMKTAGSFHFGCDIRGINLQGDSVLVHESENLGIAPMIKSNLYELGLSFGYGFNIVFAKNFVFNMTASPSLSFVYSNNKLESDLGKDQLDQWSLRPTFMASSGFAYMKGRYYLGLNANSFFFWSKISESSDYQSSDARVRLILGYRFRD